MSCTCNRITHDRYSADQCWPCWARIHVRAYQRGQLLPETGKYATRAEALANAGGGIAPVPIAPIPLHCIHEGAVLEYCKGCNSDQKHVRECQLHGKCTRGFVSVKVTTCSKCPDHHRELFPDYADPLPTHTPASDESAHIQAFWEILDNPPRYPGDNGQRGIIWTCHSPRFWLMTAIAVRRLRQLGCTLPVEVWYRSSCGSLRTEDVAGLDVTFQDRDEMARRLGDSRLPFGTPDRGGWEVKTYAATHTRLKQFWVMDNDALFIADPTNITPNCPFGYWIDLPKWKTMTQWDKFGLPNHDEIIPQVQGGHLWFDKSQAWRFIAGCQWANEHSDYFYTHSNHDQSIFRAALAQGACPGFRTFGDLGQPGGWVQRAHVCRYEGQPLIAHYCQGKLFEPEHCDQVPGDRERMLTFADILKERFCAD